MELNSCSPVFVCLWRCGLAGYSVLGSTPGSAWFVPSESSLSWIICLGGEVLSSPRSAEGVMSVWKVRYLPLLFGSLLSGTFEESRNLEAAAV